VTADVGALTAGVASSFADVCALAGIELMLDCQPSWAQVDADMWETIVLSLVSNGDHVVGPGRVEAAGEGLASGADNYLVKPFGSADLINRVEARLKAAGRDRSAGPQDDLRVRRTLAMAELGTALGAARSVDQALRELLASPLCSLT
jgi:CheY-like chemotaxis protein